MKICWDNLEDIYITKNGNFRHKTRGTLYEKDKCIVCGESFLGKKKEKTCCRKCSHVVTSKSHIGSKRSKETRKKISDKAKERNQWKGENNPRHKKGLKGDKNPNWKGGYHSKGIPLYNTYEKQLKIYDECRRNKKDPNILEVKCAYCGRWFVPSLSEVSYRISAIRGQRKGYSEHRLYCSNNCKYECPIFNKQKYPKGFNPATSREVQPQLRQIVFERDGYTCQKCGSTEHLHCHHIYPVADDPIESADVDNCITYCKECHKKAHKQDGCKYNELRCNK